MNTKNIRNGKVVIPANTNPWPQEKRVARILALAGYSIRFIPETNIKTPDIVFDSSRMKIRDDQIVRELIKRFKLGKGFKRILFINKQGIIIDINSLV